MSNPTEILIEKLELKLLLRERVFLKWEDKSGTPCTLGSRLNRNKQNLEFFIAVYYDMEGCIHVHFSITVSVIVAGKKQKMEMLFVVPPDADFANTSKPRLISDIDDLSPLDASAIHEAEISHSVYVICIQFNLTAKGFVITKKKTNTNLKPWGTISKQLMHGLVSLSNTEIFTAYIKPNDYALVGLEDLRNRLCNTRTPTDTYKANMKDIYIQQTPELMEWRGHDLISLPPPYTENAPQLSSEVQAFPRSPPITFEQETPPRTTSRLKSTSVHGIFSPSREELSDSEVSLNDIGEDSRYIEMDFNIDSDEEQLANMNSRELDHDSKMSQMLNSKLLKWMQTVMRINSNVHEHKRLTTKLSILGNCIRTSNANLFNATLRWCSALFFYDPLDSDPDNTLGLWEERNSWLISDIARLVQWANRIHHSVETNPLFLNHFIKLGDTARTVALDTRFNKDKYYDQKSVCIVCVLAEFKNSGGDGGSGISKQSKPASRKGLGTESSASKRVKL
ncbi:hypothetical protein EAE96_010927 [Botrytis aclada]|nr:hypothetical protein EAE96_010927 [Botrytis aclada]